MCNRNSSGTDTAFSLQACPCAVCFQSSQPACQTAGKAPSQTRLCPGAETPWAEGIQGAKPFTFDYHNQINQPPTAPMKYKALLQLHADDGAVGLPQLERGVFNPPQSSHRMVDSPRAQPPAHTTNHITRLLCALSTQNPTPPRLPTVPFHPHPPRLGMQRPSK